MRQVALLLLSLLAPSSAAPVPEMLPHQGMVGGLVVFSLDSYHLAPRQHDDALSACWYDGYLDLLDPDHSLLQEGDLRKLARYRTTLDDSLRGRMPSLEPAWAVVDVAQLRRQERVDYLRGLLGKPVDLSDDESILRDSTHAPRPRDKAAQQDLWRRIFEAWTLDLQLGEETPEEITKLLGARLDRMELAIEELESPDVLEGYLHALAQCYDPHTAYFKPADADNFQIQTRGSLEGIGAALIRDGEYIRVSEVLPGGPADRSKAIFKDDRIVGVAEGPGEMVSVVGMRIDNVVKLIRGPKGTVVRLELLPAGAMGATERKVLSLERDRIDLESVEPKAEVREVKGTDGKARKLLVLEVPAFAADPDDPSKPSTSQVVARLLKEHADVDGVIIDLRQNSGGYLTEGIKLTGLFIDRGPVVQVLDAEGKLEVHQDDSRGALWTGPTVVLTSPFTASASEIMAGALQDYGAAVIVGSETTYGKGSVQSVLPLDAFLTRMTGEVADPIAGMLKVTTALYYRANGRSPQNDGVQADVVLPSPFEGRVEREGENPASLPGDRIKAANFTPRGDLAPMLPTLRTRSAGRVASDARFSAIESYLAWLGTVEAEKNLSLKMTVREAQRAEAKERAEALDTALGGTLEGVSDEGTDEASGAAEAEGPEPTDPVLDEALMVLGDLAELQG